MYIPMCVLNQRCQVHGFTSCVRPHHSQVHIIFIFISIRSCCMLVLQTSSSPFSELLQCGSICCSGAALTPLERPQKKKKKVNKNLRSLQAKAQPQLPGPGWGACCWVFVLLFIIGVFVFFCFCCCTFATAVLCLPLYTPVCKREIRTEMTTMKRCENGHVSLLFRSGRV